MDAKKARLRAIPQADLLLRTAVLQSAIERHGKETVTTALRLELAERRAEILQGNMLSEISTDALLDAVLLRLEQQEKPALCRVLNATGVALHTNLGRAPLAQEALAAVQTVACGYSNLEYDLQAGVRGSRNAHLESLLCELCGCEAALAVNNNAAAVLLALATLARGREIIVSRGELVEIGDGFRIPDIMEQSGGRLVEVGSTNRTHLRDYQAAVCEQTAVLLKVHTSNFRVIGFTESVETAQLSELGKSRGIAVVADLGSGALLDSKDYPFSDEPDVRRTLRDGADIVCFSGDKLLGGPQAGILVGRRALIERMRKNPLARALRIDKLSLAALEATLRLYREPALAKERIPALRMLCADDKLLQRRANLLCTEIAQVGAACRLCVIERSRPVGGGAAPTQLLFGAAVEIRSDTISAELLEARLRHGKTPILSCIAQGAVLLDVSTLEDGDFSLIAQLVRDAL